MALDPETKIYTCDRSAVLAVPCEAIDEINRRLDDQIALVPGAASDREYLYNSLLGFLSEYGYIPEFSLVQGAGQPDAVGKSEDSDA